MNEFLKQIEDKLMLIPEIFGYFILSSDGKAKIKHFPPSISATEIDILGRNLVIMWDSLKKSGIKEGMINLRYKEALIFLKSFDGGFILVFTSKAVNEHILIKTLKESSKFLSKNLSNAILDLNDSDDKKSRNELDKIISKIKQKASEIAGPWMEYYFDEAVETWADIGKPRRIRLKELIDLMAENIDEEDLKEEFINQASEIIKEK